MWNIVAKSNDGSGSTSTATRFYIYIVYFVYLWILFECISLSLYIFNVGSFVRYGCMYVCHLLYSILYAYFNVKDHISSKCKETAASGNEKIQRKKIFKVFGKIKLRKKRTKPTEPAQMHWWQIENEFQTKTNFFSTQIK